MFRQIKGMWINIEWHDNEDESIRCTRINGVIKEDILGLNVSILGCVNLEEK